MPSPHPILLPVPKLVLVLVFSASCSSHWHFYSPSQSFFAARHVRGPVPLGTDNRVLLAPECPGAEHHKRTWRVQSCAVWGLRLRKARTHCGGGGLGSNTIGPPFPKQPPLNEPSFLLLFSHRTLGHVLSCPVFSFWARDLFQSSTFTAFISSLFSSRHLCFHHKCRYQDLPAIAAQSLRFGGEGIQLGFVGFHVLSRKGR